MQKQFVKPVRTLAQNLENRVDLCRGPNVHLSLLRKEAPVCPCSRLIQVRFSKPWKSLVPERPPRPQCLQVFVACTMKLYRQIYRQKHSVVQWTASDSTGQCKDQIKLILEVDQAKFEVSC